MDYILPIAMLVMRTKTTALNERLQVREEAY